jgi:Flp pilus assembly protein TadG
MVTIKPDLEVAMKFLKTRRAIETLEAAITFPIAILVMLATVNLGMVVYGQQAVQAAARQGARMGSVAQQCSACYAMSGASSAIGSDPIVKQFWYRFLLIWIDFSPVWCQVSL